MTGNASDSPAFIYNLFWANGYDSHEIAKMTGKHESIIVRIIGVEREKRRAKVAGIHENRSNIGEIA